MLCFRFRHLPGVPLVAVHLRMAVGSGLEHPGQAGLAHLIEHLVVSGMPARFRARVQASTSRDATDFRLLAPPEESGIAIRALLTATHRPDFDRDRYRSERDAIPQEIVERHESLAWRLQQEFLGAWWAGTRWAHSPLGVAATVRRHRRHQTLQVFRSWYPNATGHLAVVGAPRAVALARHRLGNGLSSTVTGTRRRLAYPAGPWAAVERSFVAQWTDQISGRAALGLGLAEPTGCAEVEAARDLARMVLRECAGPHLTLGRFAGRTVWWTVVLDQTRSTRLLAEIGSAMRRAAGAIERGAPGRDLLERARVRLLRGREDVQAQAAWLAGAEITDARAVALLGERPVREQLHRWSRHCEAGA